MVDLASLGLLVGPLLCRFSLSEEFKEVAPLVGGWNSSTGSSPVKRLLPLRHRGREVATHKEAADGSNATQTGLPSEHRSDVLCPE